MLWKLGEMIGSVEEIDTRCLFLEVVQFVRVKVVRLVGKGIPKTLSLEVGDLRFDLRTKGCCDGQSGGSRSFNGGSLSFVG